MMRLTTIAILILGVVPSMAWSQPDDRIRPEKNTDPRFDTILQPIQPVAPTAIGEPTAPRHGNGNKSVDKSYLTVDDLKNNFTLTEQLLNQAMLDRNWEMAAHLLIIYEGFTQKDQVLAWYVSGALARQEGKHRKAIDAYRRILAEKPDLIYARFDLAIMLFENKEYEAALDQFRKVKAGNIKPQYQDIVDQYIVAIQKQDKWDVNLTLQYTQTSNVNNASKIKDFKVGNATFVKDENSLPQKATGVRYGVGVDRSWNVVGNHSVTVSANLEGVEYWDNADYNEQTARMGVGYKYQDVDSWATLSPYMERNWFSGRPYMDSIGVTMQYGKWFNRHWQGSAAYSVAQKSYVNKGMDVYDGKLHSTSLGLMYLYSPTLIFTAGVDYQRDNVKSEDNSYQRYGGRLGLIKEFEKGISTRLDIRYGHKTYDKQSFLAQAVRLGMPRKDDEYRTSITVWHRALRFYNITPKLTIGYQKIDSNLPMYYSRSNKEAYVVLEKAF